MNVLKGIWNLVREVQVALSLWVVLATLPLVGIPAVVNAVLLNLELPNWVIIVVIAIINAVSIGILVSMVGVIQRRRHEKRMLELLVLTVQYIEMRQDETQERNKEAFLSVITLIDSSVGIIESLCENDRKLFEDKQFLLKHLSSIDRRKADKPGQSPFERWLD